LPTKGNEAQLKARHQEFITLWNAETDSDYPRSPKELVEVIMKREQAQLQEKTKEFHTGVQNHTAYIQNILRMGTSGNTEFDKEWRARYAELIRGGKEQKLKERMASKTETSEDAANNGNGSNDAASDAPLDTKMTENVSRQGEDDAVPACSPAISAQKKFTPSKEESVASDITSTMHSPPSSAAPPVAQLSNTRGGSNSLVIDLVGESTETIQITPDTKHTSSRSATLRQLKHSPSIAQSRNPIKMTPRSSKSPQASLSQNTLHVVRQQGKRKVASSVATDAVQSKRKRRTICGPWQCEVCTYLNEKHTWTNADCEMCTSPRAGVALCSTSVH
jgi:hypothetical protein